MNFVYFRKEKQIHSVIRGKRCRELCKMKKSKERRENDSKSIKIVYFVVDDAMQKSDNRESEVELD
jgi:hypothetical protein